MWVGSVLFECRVTGILRPNIRIEESHNYIIIIIIIM